MVVELDRCLGEALDECFPIVTTRRRPNDLPWMTKGIRKKIDQRKSIFKQEGSSPRCKRLKELTKKILTQRKQAFIEDIKKKACETNNTKYYYEAVKMLRDKEKPEPWDVCLLYTSPSPRD